MHIYQCAERGWQGVMLEFVGLTKVLDPATVEQEIANTWYLDERSNLRVAILQFLKLLSRL